MTERIVVLLSTYNGSRFLREQVESIRAQKEASHELFVRDDGSTDLTPAILDEYAANGVLRWYRGANLGPARSFFELLSSAPDREYYAFADQDDYWDDDKLSSALAMLQTVDSSKPAIYWCATRPVDESLRPISFTPAQVAEIDFPQTLLRSFASGCTMVLNHALRSTVLAKPNPLASMHDSWVLKVCFAVGGAALIDPKPHISYRQHDANVIGFHSTLGEKIRRWVRYIWSTNRTREREATALLERYESSMSVADRDFAFLMSTYRATLSGKLRLVRHPSVWANGPFVGLTTAVAVVINRL